MNNTTNSVKRSSSLSRGKRVGTALLALAMLSILLVSTAVQMGFTEQAQVGSSTTPTTITYEESGEISGDLTYLPSEVGDPPSLSA